MTSIDVSGQRFGRLVAVSVGGKIGQKRAWRCLCDCGKECTIPLSNLRSGNTASCGCGRDEATVRRSLKHGRTRTPEYSAWMQMIQRCGNRNNPRWKGYGGRGIRVCSAWRSSFTAFFLSMGERPTADHSIDRIDNDGNYEPGNCRWATRTEQANNKRRRVAA